MLSCICSLYILDTNPFQLSFAHIFSHSVGCLLVLFILSFAVQKVFYFDAVPSLFLLLFPLPQETDISRKKLLRPVSKRLLPVFSSRVFMVSGLTLKSFIHFEFIFVYGIRK